MAVLTVVQKGEISKAVAQKGTTVVSYTKPVAFAAIQAIEDWFETNRTNLSTAINIATAPTVLTIAHKSAFVKFWFQQKFERE